MKFISSLIAFSLVILISIFVFAPDRIPAGYGIEPVPIEMSIENSLAGQILESVTGSPGITLKLTNRAQGPLYNVTVSLMDASGTIKHQMIKSRLPVAESLQAGWVNQWKIVTGDSLQVKASLYQPVEWAL